jgi:signal recognition particle receptor subunit beta
MGRALVARKLLVQDSAIPAQVRLKPFIGITRRDKMVVISYSGKEANAKIVYYGPGLGGKTTNLEFIYDSVPASSRGKMVSMKTQTDRTLFFDFLPLDLGELGGFKTRFLLYTVPGQVFYNATRKLVLRGVDAVAFIADSMVGKMGENKESLANLEENLADYDMKLDDIPCVLQYNKRDLPEIYTVEELNRELNVRHVPYFDAVAKEGTGVFETFRGLSRLLLEKLSEEIGHRMVISKSFGRRQEQEGETVAPEATPIAEAEPAREPEEVEPETIELASQASPEVSEVDVEELEILPEEAGARPSEGELATGPQAEPIMRPRVEPEPAIAHEHGIVRGFFGETTHSTPLEKEIVREEVILSKEADLAAVSQVPVREQVTETMEQPAELSVEQLGEQAGEQVATSQQVSQQATQRERPTEQAIQSEKDTEPSGQEPFFRHMVRRNNIGVFGQRQREALEHAKSSGSSEQVSTDVKSHETVIEIPASMLQGEEEIVITLRLRRKADVEDREAPADEFLLDGISR